MQRAAIFIQADVQRAELQRDVVLVQPHINLAHGRTRGDSHNRLVRAAVGRVLKGILGPLPAARSATVSH